MGNRDDYRFLEIRDAIVSINQKVNLIGVVIEFGLPRKTRGTDCFCSLKIVDQSHPKPGISVNVFAENMERLPRVASAGDIILLTHVVMKIHHGEAYAVFNKRFSAFALYEGKDSDDFLPYQVSSKFPPRDVDKKFIASLRKWLVGLQIDEGSSNFSIMSSMKKGELINLACKIIQVCEVAKDEWMAFVWDGTDVCPVEYDQRIEDELENPLPLHLEPLPLSRDVLCTFPTVGTVLRVKLDCGIEKCGLYLLNPGRWVKFVNILCEVHAGMWYGVLTSFTKLRYTSNEDHHVLERTTLHNSRLSSNPKWRRIPKWSFPWMSHITEVDYEDVPVVTLMDVLTHSERFDNILDLKWKQYGLYLAILIEVVPDALSLRSYPSVKVTAKFKCVVRVVAALPWQAAEFRCSPGPYRIRLTLEDPTARIHAYIYAEDGEKFFDGYPSLDELTKKRNALLGIAESDNVNEAKNVVRKPPWLQCCLKSYYLTKSDPWGSKHYRIFGTKVVVD